MLELSNNASGFIVVPSSNSGTLWELSFLKRTRDFEGCYFFMQEHQSSEGDQFAAWMELRSTLSPIMRLPNFTGSASMFALDSDGRPHVVPLSGTMILSGSTKRLFITSSAIEKSLEILTSIAERQKDNEIREFVEFSTTFIEALAAGKKRLLNFERVSEEIKSALISIDDPIITSLWSSGSFEWIDECEEFCYQELEGNVYRTVRHEAQSNDDRLVFYVSIDDTERGLTVVGIGVTDSVTDLRVREHIAGELRSAE